MARTREFQEDVALERALHAFWHRGYEGTSMEALLDATGLSKSSLYQAFGSKRHLLEQSLALFERQLWEGPLEPLASTGADLPEIAATFARMIDRAMSPHGQRGCFVNSCLAECAPHDAAMLASTRGIIGRIEAALARAVANAQAGGRIAADENAGALAVFLLNTLSGINLAAKAKPPRERLESIARIALNGLQAPAAPASKHSAERRPLKRRNPR